MTQYKVHLPREVVLADKLMIEAAKAIGQAIDPAPSPHVTVHDQHDKDVGIKKDDFGLGIIKAIDTTYHPKDGTFFQYNAASPAPGELPSNQVGSFQIADQTGRILLDIFGFKPLTFAQLATLDTIAEINTYFFSSADNITGSSGGDLLNGYGGGDTISGGGGNDTLYGGASNDVVNGDAGNDLIFGQDGLDRLTGGIGNDTISGGASADVLAGGDGNDTLKGDIGNDTMTGGFGADTMTGGTGFDHYKYQTLPQFNGKESGLTAATRDVITDFKHGEDKIDPSFILVPKFKFLGTAALTGLGQINFKFVGADTLVQISTDSDSAAELSILLKGHIQLTVGDFIL